METALNGLSMEEHPPVSLFDLLSTSIVLDYVVASLPLPSLLALSATSKSFSRLILQTPGTFRYLDLSLCRGAQVRNSEPLDSGGNVWRSERMDEALTEDEFYTGPLRGIFSHLRRRNLLQHVQVLILDGLSVTMELISEIITSDTFSVKFLSVVGCRNLNEGQLQQLLRHVCRPGRPDGTPRLKGIYVFSKRKIINIHAQPKLVSQVLNVLSMMGSQPTVQSNEDLSLVPNDEAWWAVGGQVLDPPTKHGLRQGWEQTMAVCEGLIAFDGILCPNKQHFPDDLSSSLGMPRPLATVSLSRSGCAACGKSPQLREGPLRWSHLSPSSFPLLSPPPHSGKLELATAPPLEAGQDPELIVSCEECLKGRWCSECNRYWCHNCFPSTSSQPIQGSTDENGPGSIKIPPVSRDCWECGILCHDCQKPRQRTCRSCKTSYCRIHNTDCDDRYCEWCRLGGRRTRELY